MTDTKKAIVVLSGGLDSTVLLYHVRTNLKRDTTAICFDYGQRHSRELDFAKFHCNNLNLNLRTVNLNLPTSSMCSLLNTNVEVPHIKDVLGDPQPNTYVPNRNMMFLSIAAAAAEIENAEEIYYGAAEIDTHSGNWDCSLDFLDYMNQTLSLNRRNTLKVVAPFITYSKIDIIKLGKELSVPLEYTHTCYKGEEVACGVCSSCSSRIKGFIDAGIADPIKYNIPIKWK